MRVRKLTEVEKFYVNHHLTKTTKELAKDLDTAEKSVKNYMESEEFKEEYNKMFKEMLEKNGVPPETKEFIWVKSENKQEEVATVPEEKPVALKKTSFGHNKGTTVMTEGQARSDDETQKLMVAAKKVLNDSKDLFKPYPDQPSL